MDSTGKTDSRSYSVDGLSHEATATVFNIGKWARWFRIVWWGHRIVIVLAVAYLQFAANLPSLTRDMFTAVDTRLMYASFGVFFFACIISGLIGFFDMRRINFASWPLFLSFWSTILIVAIASLSLFAQILDRLRGEAGTVSTDTILSQHSAWNLAAIVFSLIVIVYLLRIRRASISEDDDRSTIRLSQLPARRMTRPLALRRFSVVCLHLVNLLAVFALLHPVVWVLNYFDSFILPEVLYRATADPYVLHYDQKMDWMKNLLWLHHGREAPAHAAWNWIGRPVILIIVAVLAFRTGLKIIRKSEGGIWRGSGISPILLLRSFNDDHAVIRPTSWFRRLTGRNVRLEETVARELAVDGPLVAIGKPGEMLPELGAYRLYFPDDRWQAEVLEQLRRCQCVVVVGGTTHWVLWELQQVVQNNCAAKLLFVLPPCSPLEKGERIAPLVEVLDLAPSQVQLIRDQLDKLLVVNVLADGRLDLLCSDSSTQSDYQVACRVGLMHKRLTETYSAGTNVIAFSTRPFEPLAAPEKGVSAANQGPPAAVGKRSYGRRILTGGAAALLGVSGIAVADALLGNFAFGRHLTFVDLLGCDTYVHQFQSPYGATLIDPDRALAVCQDALASDEDNPAYLQVVGSIELAQRNYGTALKHLRASANQGYTPAMLWLAGGLLFQELPDQFEGIDEQRAEGVKWVLRASDNGEEDAYFSLALAMSVSKDRDLVSAAYWLIALQKGSSQAFFTLADVTMYQLSRGIWQLTLDLGPTFKAAFPRTQHGVEVILADLGFFRETPDETWTYATMEALYRYLHAGVKIDPLNLCFARGNKEPCYRRPYARKMRSIDDVIAHYLELEVVTILDALSSKRPAKTFTQTVEHPGHTQEQDLTQRRLSLVPLGQAIGSLYPKLLSRRGASAGEPTECDRLAAHQFDPNRVAKGVPFEQLQPDAAIAACSDAIRKAPEEMRFRYQRGRAYLKLAERVDPAGGKRSERYANAQADFRYATAQGYPMAHYALAVMKVRGDGVAKDLEAGAARHVEAFNRIVYCCGAAVAEHLIGVKARYDQASVTRAARMLLQWGASLRDPKSRAALIRHFGSDATYEALQQNAHISFSSDPRWTSTHYPK